MAQLAHKIELKPTPEQEAYFRQACGVARFANEVIVLKLREMDIAGATVYKGILGYGAGQRIHRSRFLDLASFFGVSRNLPLLITVVDKAEKIDGMVPTLQNMLAGGLMTISNVEVIKYSHGISEAGEFSLTPEHPTFGHKE